MKGEAMQNIDKTETTAASRRRVMWIGLGAVAILGVGGGIWFSTQHAGKPKAKQEAPMSSMSDMSSMSSKPSPANNDATDSTAADAGVQVDLGPDDLKKAQIQTVHVDMRETASTLRVPEPLTRMSTKKCMSHLWSAVSSDRFCGARGPCAARPPMAVVFSSDLADAETGYLAMLAELEADHKTGANREPPLNSEQRASRRRKRWRQVMPRTRPMCVPRWRS